HHENKPFYRTDAWKYVRSKVYERGKGCCQRCGRFVFGRSAHVHHVIPIKEDPTLKLEENNLRLLCPVCHTIEENEDKPKKVFPSYFGSPPIKN
ncbi:HNH endonuclease signature motif containing protein, partial [Bacillus thuringiensis]|nr:HNH endonuclease signature motif containing protein [Bacillus thuringiensis]